MYSRRQRSHTFSNARHNTVCCKNILKNNGACSAATTLPICLPRVQVNVDDFLILSVLVSLVSVSTFVGMWIPVHKTIWIISITLWSNTGNCQALLPEPHGNGLTYTREALLHLRSIIPCSIKQVYCWQKSYRGREGSVERPFKPPLPSIIKQMYGLSKIKWTHSMQNPGWRDPTGKPAS